MIGRANSAIHVKFDSIHKDLDGRYVLRVWLEKGVLDLNKWKNWSMGKNRFFHVIAIYSKFSFAQNFPTFLAFLQFFFLSARYSISINFWLSRFNWTLHFVHPTTSCKENLFWILLLSGLYDPIGNRRSKSQLCHRPWGWLIIIVSHKGWEFHPDSGRKQDEKLCFPRPHSFSDVRTRHAWRFPQKIFHLLCIRWEFQSCWFSINSRVNPDSVPSL